MSDILQGAEGNSEWGGVKENGICPFPVGPVDDFGTWATMHRSHRLLHVAYTMELLFMQLPNVFLKQFYRWSFTLILKRSSPAMGHMDSTGTD